VRIDPAQRFTCSQCGRCCHGWDVVVSGAEVELYRRRHAESWFSAGEAVADEARPDPFEPMPGRPGLHRIRKRADGGCGFLSAANRCRIHEELGADRKPLTCRMFPYSLHAAPDAVVVIASFGCPTIIANEGRPIAVGAEAEAIEKLRQEWLGTSARRPASSRLVAGRTIDTRSTRVLRESLLAILKADTPDLRVTLRRIAAVLDDLTRHRVVSLSDDAFAEYVLLTVPHAAAKGQAPPPQAPGSIGRLLQYGFLYAVTATKLAVERRGQSAWALRLMRLRLLAHFHRLAPSMGRIDVGALSRRPDINAPEIRPIVFHYLRSTLEALGARNRPIVDDVAISVSYLNAALSLAVMHAAAARHDVDRETLTEALMDAVLLSHADHGRVMEGILRRLAGGTESLRLLQSDR
jgi:Fe-S-cluster containining protein